MTYKARKAIHGYLDRLPKPEYDRCPCCNPIPGEEVVGFREPDGRITLHKRDWPLVIRLASRQGDNIVSVDFKEDGTLYPVSFTVTAVDRYHLFIDLVDSITNGLHLTMDSFNTRTVDSIVTCTISLSVHSFTELQSIMRHISVIDGVDEVKRLQTKNQQ